MLGAGSSAAQISIISKTESNNKLRRISNMKKKTPSNSSGMDRPPGLILASSAMSTNKNDGNTSAAGVVHQFTGSGINQ